MTTQVAEALLEARDERTWADAHDWVCDVLAAEDLDRARNTLGVTEPATLDLVVDGEVVASLTIDGSLGHACGVSIASALLERQSRGHCGTWELRLSVHDEEIGAELLIREWRCPD